MNIFFKSAIRSFIKNVNLNIINVLGISIGLAISTLCFLFIQHEFSFDRHFRKIDGIYRIVSQYKDNSGNTINTRGTPSYLMQAVKETCPEVINTSRVFYGGVFIKSPETEDVFSQRVATVDKEIIDILSLNFIRGSKANAFDKPYSIVITEEIASKLFRDKNPIGESLKMQGFYFPDKLFEITGVIDNIPENSSIDFDILTSEGSFLPDWLWRSWSETGGYLPVQTFIHVSKCDINNLNEKINRLIKQNYTPEFHEKIEFDLQALSRIHLYSMTDFSFGSGGNINYIYIFLTLSLLILIIVMINFYNISNGQVYNRVTEVGIKKVFGSTILHLVVSFLFETFILVLICIPLIFLFIKLSLPVFNAAIYSNIDLAILSKSTVFIQYIVFVVVLALVIGIFPSLKYSRISPSQILGKQHKIPKKAFAKNAMIVAQFCIVVVLIVLTFHINRQFKYLVEKDLGFERENIIVTPILSSNSKLRNRIEEVKKHFLQNPNITATTVSHALIGTYAESHVVEPEGRDEMNMLGLGVDDDYIDFYNLEIVEGRDFLKYSKSDDNAVILNQKAVEILGWDKPIGKRFEFREIEGVVIGVVKDFNFDGLNNKMQPAYMQKQMAKNWLALKFNGNSNEEVVAFIKDTYKKLSPDAIPAYYFLDDILLRQFSREKTTMQMFGIFSMLAMVLTCVGLFGITLEVCRRRTKEIGIRKVNGSTTKGIMYMLNVGFLKWVAIAFVVACPIAYYAMNKWLENFAYKTTLSWWIFALAGVLALGIALLTVSWQSWRAATRNPIEALRYE